MTTRENYVLYLFMNAPRPNAAPEAASGPQDQGVKPAGRLLGLVRRMLDYGRELVASLKQQNTRVAHVHVARTFGTFDLALIIARITRGLMIAGCLEDRLVRIPPARELCPADANRLATPKPARPRIRRMAKSSRVDDDAADLPNRMPTAEEIAERLRNRPAGAVLVEICRDLGITTEHPLWREIHLAIIEYGGNTVRLMNARLAWCANLLANPWPDPALMANPGVGEPAVAGTGPP